MSKVGITWPKQVKLRLHEVIYRLLFYSNSVIHISWLSNSHNNVASIQNNRCHKSHRVVVGSVKSAIQTYETPVIQIPNRHCGGWKGKFYNSLSVSLTQVRSDAWLKSSSVLGTHTLIAETVVAAPHILTMLTLHSSYIFVVKNLIAALVKIWVICLTQFFFFCSLDCCRFYLHGKEW